MRWLTLSLEATISVSGPFGQPIYRENAAILVEIWNRFFLKLWWKVVFETRCFTAQKRQKLVTDMCYKSYSSPQPQWRSSWQKLALVLSFTNLCFTCGLMYADTTKWVPFLITKEIFDWNHALERLRSHEHSVEHIDDTITISRRCN